MKKYILVLILFIPILFGCSDYNDITDLIFIDSMAIKYEDNKYHLTLHLSNPQTLITQEQAGSNVEVRHETFENSGVNLFSCFRSIDNNINHEISLALVKSIILDKSMIRNAHLNHLINFVKQTEKLYPTFNVFVCLENIDKIYDVSSPNNSSPYYSLIGLNDDIYTINNLEYLHFASNFLHKNLPSLIPIIKVNENILKQTDYKVTLEIDGLLSFNKDTDSFNTYLYKDYDGLNYINEYKNKTVIIRYQNIANIVNIANNVTIEIERLVIEHIIVKSNLELTLKVICNNIYKDSEINLSDVIRTHIETSLKDLLLQSLKNNDKLIDTRGNYNSVTIKANIILT